MNCKIVLMTIFVSVVLVFLFGCEPTEKFEKQVWLSEPFLAGKTFQARTHNGGVKVLGGDIQRCDVTATITAKADTIENAEKLANRVEVLLVEEGSAMKVVINKPAQLGKYIGVSLDVVLPKQTSLELETHNGGVSVTDVVGNMNAETHNGKVELIRVSGEIDARTHNGRIEAGQVSGDIDLETHNGGIECRGVSGKVELVTHNGGISSDYELGEGPADIDIVTYNGSIDLACPVEFAGSVDVATHNGSISTDLPITIEGQLFKRSIRGSIGQGDGKLRLKTHNGSIKIRKK